ncbi:MAG: hypothetical protein IKE30_06815 [Clostridia bacterium]|nr:hypothetical protein [Clostridia bacterium]
MTFSDGVRAIRASIQYNSRRAFAVNPRFSVSENRSVGFRNYRLADVLAAAHLRHPLPADFPICFKETFEICRNA